MHILFAFQTTGREPHSSRESFSVSRTVGSNKASCCRTPDPGRARVATRVVAIAGRTTLQAPMPLTGHLRQRGAQRHARLRPGALPLARGPRVPPPPASALHVCLYAVALTAVCVTWMCFIYYHETPAPPPFLLVPLLHFSRTPSSFSLQK